MRGEHDMTDALAKVAVAIERLGNNGSSSDLGGLEALGMAILEASQNIAGAITRLAVAIEDREGTI